MPVEGVEPTKPHGAVFHLGSDVFARGMPEYKGDGEAFDAYLVVYDDGYVSWSPAKAFEEGYTRIEATAAGLSQAWDERRRVDAAREVALSRLVVVEARLNTLETMHAQLAAHVNRLQSVIDQGGGRGATVGDALANMHGAPR